MQVLLKCEVTQILPQPPEQSMELGLKNLKQLMSYQKEGKIVAGGVMAGRRGSCVIFDVESMEEFQLLVSRLPMYPFMELEIVPLVSFDSTAEVLER